MKNCLASDFSNFLSLKDGLVGHHCTMGGADMGQENFITSVMKRHKIGQKHLPNYLEYIMAFIFLFLHYDEPRGRSERRVQVFACWF